MADSNDDDEATLPVTGVGGRAASPVSEMTTPSSTRRRARDSERINATTLDELIRDDTFSPMKRLFAAREEEEQYDRQAYTDNPGAVDSEDEEEVDICGEFLTAATDRQQHEEENETVLTDFGDMISMHKEQLAAEQEAIDQLNGAAIFQEDLAGAPVGWKKPGPPNDWVPEEPKVEKGKPASFTSVDNPGNWARYTYYPRFLKGGAFAHYALPTGAQPMPVDSNSTTKAGPDPKYQLKILSIVSLMYKHYGTQHMLNIILYLTAVK